MRTKIITPSAFVTINLQWGKNTETERCLENSSNILSIQISDRVFLCGLSFACWRNELKGI